MTFDPAQIGVREILEIFFATHDPTTLNRQGNDVGTQYRSAIYFTDPAHQDVAEELLRQMGQDKLFGAPVVTEVAPLVNYWPAEDYHQDYYRNHPNQAIAPSSWGRRWRSSARPSHGTSNPAPDRCAAQVAASGSTAFPKRRIRAAFL